MSIINSNRFLVSVSQLSMHLVLTGFRFARNRKTDQTQNIDNKHCIYGLVSAISLIGLAIYFFAGCAGSFAEIAGISGIILLLNIVND